MTRENKVALVVGFALVLFVGILISDHFSRARARPADLIPAAAEPAPPSRHILDVRREAPVPAPLPPAAPPSLAAAQPPPQAATVPTVSASSPTAAPTDSPAAAATPAPAAPAAAPALRVHEVRPGESLSAICQRYYGDQRFIEKLAAYNNIDDPDNVWGGARLQVPPLDVLAPGTPGTPGAAGKPAKAPASAGAKSARYEVQDGDTLCSIAQRLLQSRSRWKQLYEVNREVISDPDKLRPGSVLRIPAG